MTWEMNSCQVTPKVVVISRMMPPPAAGAAAARSRFKVMAVSGREVGAGFWPRTRACLHTFREEDREKHDAFSKGRAQDRLHEDFGGGSGIASDCLGRLPTDDSDANRRAYAGRRDMEIAGHRFRC